MIAKSLRVKNSNFLQQICKCIGSVQIPSEKHLLHINRYYIQRKEDDRIVGASVKSATVSTICSPCSPTAQKIMSLISRNNRVISCLVLLLLVHTVFDSRKDGNQVRRVRGTTALQTAGYVLPPQKLRIIAETKLEDSKVEVKVLSTDSIYQRESWDGSPVVLESHKLVFFTTAKVGCTTFKMLFRRMMGFENYAEESRDGPTGRMLPWNPEKNGLKYLYDYDLDRATDMMTSPDWTRAIFVRDPKERLLSAYLDKMMYNPGYIVQKCCRDSSCIAEGQESLERFFNIVVKQCEDNHWQPQSDRLDEKVRILHIITECSHAHRQTYL